MKTSEITETDMDSLSQAIDYYGFELGLFIHRAPELYIFLWSSPSIKEGVTPYSIYLNVGEKLIPSQLELYFKVVK